MPRRSVKGCHHLGSSLLFLVLLCAVAADSPSNYVCVQGLDSPGATIPKGDILLEKGSSLEIFCNLNTSHKAAYGRNSSSLVFYRNDKKVSSEFVEIINTTTVRLFVKNLPPSIDYYYCMLELPQNMTGICLNMVAAGFKPQEVKDFQCISQNWQNLTCRWIKPENPIRTTYKLHFYLPGRAGKRMTYSCPDHTKKSAALKAIKDSLQKNEEMCFWDLETGPHYRQPYEYYYFEMKGQNKLGNVTFSPMKFHHYSHVIPSPPERLTVINTTSNSAFLSWAVPYPMTLFPPGVNHRIVYQSAMDTNKSWQVANASYLKTHESNHTYNLTDLKYANTLYDVRVYLRSVFAVGEDKWSHHAFTTFKTAPTVPGAPPDTVIGCFETIPAGVTRDVNVYWQHIPHYLQNGDNFSYQVISVKENGVEKRFIYELTSTFAKFKNLTYNHYEFTIVSNNNIGYSVGKSIVNVPSKEDMPREPVSFTKIAFHDGIYELSWKAPSESPDIESYTIFWCRNNRDRPYPCTGLLNWTVVTSNVTMKNITVPDDSSIYQFAISANTRNASSGMVWASCTVIHNEVVGKMKSVWINRIGATFIEVGWKLECSDRIGRVEGFVIDFCPILSPRDTKCKEPQKNLTLEALERQFHGNVTGLKPYTTYMVTIAILTNNGKGVSSDPLFNTTMEAAPTVPQNVKVTNVTNSSMIVLWDTPAARNGVLRYYKVFLNNEYPIIAENLNSTMYKFENLTSFTSYKVRISACTVDCSEQSTSVEIKTQIGNPGKPDQPHSRFLNVSQILVQWKPPIHRGGTLNYYQVSVQQSDGDKNASKYEYNSTDTESQIPIPECVKEKSRVKYMFWIRAVNIGENGRTYYGPWSESGETNCYNSGPSAAVKISIYIISVLFVLALCIVLAYTGRRLWKRCKDMRNIDVKLPPGLAPPGEKEKDQDYPIDVTWQSDGDHHLTGKVRPSADEELLLKKKEERHGRNPSGDSSGCSSGHESVSSSLTSGTQISSDSGTEVDQRPPSPDGVFDESPPHWGAASLRLRKASSSVARSTPNLSDVEGLSTGPCVGPWSSTGYISMHSNEEVAGEGTSYCRVGLEASPTVASGSQMSQSPQSPQLPQSFTQAPGGKGYVSLPLSTSPTSPQTPQMQPTSVQPISQGYVSHQVPWVSPKESPNKGYVMAGELGDLGGGKMSPSSLMVMEVEDDHSILEFDAVDGDPQTPESYCRFGLYSVQPVEGSSESEVESTVKPASGYVTLGEGSCALDASTRRGSTSSQGQRAAGGYVPHRHFEKRNPIPLSASFQEEADESYKKIFPTNSGEAKSPTTNV